MATSATELESSAIEEQLLAAARELLTELGNADTASKTTLASSLERDLGLGSLERVELLVRVERRVERRLPEEVAQTADTLSDWARALAESEEPSQIRLSYNIRPERPAPPAPSDAKDFAEVLQRHAEREPERVQVHLVEEDELFDIPYALLLQRSSEVAAGLAAAGLEANQTVAIMLPTCADFFYAFLGVTLAGGIAVPIYPPARPDKIEEYVQRQTLILKNAGVRFLITFDRVRAVSQVMRLTLPSLLGVTTVAALRERGGAAAPSGRTAEAFFIQYTSGSTGNPKGVVLTHDNVLANVKGIGWAVQAQPDDIVVSWLPLYHDMGLIGSWLFSLYYGLPITILSPLAFLSRPERWLWALSDARATLCPAPNFSYELCARKIRDEALEGVDLSRWRVAINAGEPVLPGTLEHFARRFAPYGFRPESFVPCYGLAESSVALTFPQINRRPVIDVIERRTFEREGKAVPAREDGGNVLRFAANGRPLPEHQIRIVDDEGRDLPERVQGRLLFKGPSKTSGYYRNPEATAAVTTEEGWMDSGDLAYRADGEIYVTGRKKDCIIKAGHNVIPQEVEMAAAEVAGVRRGCVAAFGTVDAESGTERIVVVAETRVQDPSDLERIRGEVIKVVDARAGLPPDHVELVPPQTVPKTSSGKIRRNECRQLYESGALRIMQRRPPWLQMVRLWMGNLGNSLYLAWRGLIQRLQRAATATLDASVAIGGGMAARLCPSRRGGAHTVQAAARLLLRTHGHRPRLEGGVHLDGRPVLLAVARSGKMDALVLAGALPAPILLAEENMLASLPQPLGFLLEPLVAPAAEAKGDFKGGALAARVNEALQEGERVAVFADNPLDAPAQRSRFRLEPLQAAASNAASVIPVCFNGTPARLGRVNSNARRSQTTIQLGPALPPPELSGAGVFREELRRALGRLARQGRPTDR